MWRQVRSPVLLCIVFCAIYSTWSTTTVRRYDPNPDYGSVSSLLEPVDLSVYTDLKGVDMESKCKELCNRKMQCLEAKVEEQNCYMILKSDVEKHGGTFLYKRVDEKDFSVTNLNSCEYNKDDCVNIIPDNAKQCRNYKVLNGYTRSIKELLYKEIKEYPLKIDLSPYQCFNINHPDKSNDWQGDSWYRLIGPAGSVIPERTTGSSTCGTGESGLLTGSHPTKLYESIYSEVCGLWDPNKCDISVEQVQVTNCGGYFVYKLTNSICSLRYCSAHRDITEQKCSLTSIDTPYGYLEEFQGSLYHFSTKPKLWDDAEDYCQFSFGGHLVSIHSKEEMDFLRKRLADFRLTGTWYIGGSRIGESWDEWTWSDGSTNDWPEFSHYWTWSDGSTDDGLGISMSKYGNFFNALGVNKDKKFICKVTCPNSTN